MNTNQIDYGIVAVCVYLASRLFGHEVAALVGPYVVILLASTIGASFSLARRDPTTRTAAALFFLRINGLALLVTVGIASIANSYHETWAVSALLAPIAFIVGFIGDNWPKVLGWAGRQAERFIDILIKLKGGQP